MSTSNGSTHGRPSARGFRAPVAAAGGAALLGLSLLLSVGPALGAANNTGNSGNGNSSSGGGNGTSGNVKVHDAGTGVETSGGDNEPHVCDFWLGFTLEAPFEAGTWIVVSWPPTGDGSTVASGVYDTSGDGVDSSGVIEVPAGHYRVAWAATGATVSKKKTFWVDAECDEPVTPDPESPVEEAASPVEESPIEQSSGDEASPSADESQVEEPAPPADETAPPVDEIPVEEAASPVEEPPVDESPAEELASPVEDTPADESSAQEFVSPVEEPPMLVDDELTDPGDESGIEDLVPPADQGVAEGDGAPGDEPPDSPATAAADEEPAQAQDQVDAPAASGEPTMSDTAVTGLPVPSGLAATLGLLLLIVAHATAWRAKRSDIRA